MRRWARARTIQAERAVRGLCPDRGTQAADASSASNLRLVFAFLHRQALALLEFTQGIDAA